MKGLASLAGRRRWRPADARVAIEAWKGSGQSVRTFELSHGLSRDRISRWVAKLGSDETAASTVTFHPVRVVDGGRERAGAGRSERIEVVLADGRRVRVGSGFAAEDLARVLAVLEGGRSC